MTITIAMAAALLVAPVAASAKPTNAELAAKLSDPKQAPGALEQLVARKGDAVSTLIGEALEGKDLEARGWAIAGLAEIGGKDAEKALIRLTDDTKAPMLVRTWAVAARINMAQSLDAVVAMASLAQTFPAAQRPLTLKVTALASGKGASAESLLTLAKTNHQLRQLLAEAILAQGVDPLVEVMARSKDADLRQQAAGFLGALAQRQGAAGNEVVGLAVAKAYAFDADARDVPWAGGPLYVPNIGWKKQFAMKLTRNLVAWHVWCGVRGRKDDQKKIHHSLNSVSLAAVIGYQVPGWGKEDADWLRIWGVAAGKKEVRRILQEQGLEKKKPYRDLLEDL